MAKKTSKVFDHSRNQLLKDPSRDDPLRDREKKKKKKEKEDSELEAKNASDPSRNPLRENPQCALKDAGIA
jgi:hypothetical protein